MPVTVQTQSGSTYVFSEDGGRLLERRSENAVRNAPRGYLAALPAEVRHFTWPPQVGRGMVFQPVGDDGVVQTSNVVEVNW